jgi:hypothetical protein
MQTVRLQTDSVGADEGAPPLLDSAPLPEDDRGDLHENEEAHDAVPDRPK